MSVPRFSKSLIVGAAGAVLAGMMTGFRDVAPPTGGTRTPTFERESATYRDGLGRRKPKKQHPKHGCRIKDVRRQMFNEKVRSTHSDREDPRDDKYLHSHARQMRALRAFMASWPEA